MEDLLAKIAQNDRQAQAAFYNATKSAVYGYALSVVRNTHLAEDIMQNAYIKVFCGAGRYRPMGKPMAWVFTIVRNMALSELRKGRAEVALPVHESVQGQDDDGARQDALALAAVLERLGNDERQIVTLHCVAGFKHREIADFMQIRLSTVLSKYRRSLKN